jgi:hypothetical protein
VEQLKRPVILKDPREFGLIAGFRTDGGIILPAAEKIRELYDSLKQELKSRAGAEEDYCFTKSFKELLSHEETDPRQEEIEDAERWALGSEDFHPDELNDKLMAIIEEVDEKNFGRRAVDHTFLEEVMEKKLSEELKERTATWEAMPEMESGLDR